MYIEKARILIVAGWSYSVRTRLKDLLRQYELRERHFECVIRSKELEVLLSRARAAEQKQLAEGEKVRAEKVEDEVRPCPRLCFFNKEKKNYHLSFFFGRISSSERSWTMRRRLRRCW